MATTTNYGWTTPDDTDLVKDGAAAIRTLGSSIDTTTKNLNPETTTGDIAYRSATANVNTRLGLGTAGQVLRVNSGATAPEWATTADQTPLTTKGDLFGFDTADARIPIGTNGHVLTADSAQSLGLKWAAPAGGGKVLQVVQGTSTTSTSITSTSYVDSGLSATITPASASNTILALIAQYAYISDNTSVAAVAYQLVRSSTAVYTIDSGGSIGAAIEASGSGSTALLLALSGSYLDSPSTTSATTYKMQAKVRSGDNVYFQHNSTISTLILLEIGA